MKCVVVFFSLLVGIKSCGDFYWRDYTGNIPIDAVEGGPYYSTSGEITRSYIGQGYVHGFGLMIGRITAGNPYINVACYGVKTVTENIKILCAQDKSKYYWVSTTSATYAKDTLNKCPVLGGYDYTLLETANLTDGDGKLVVGRSSADPNNNNIGDIAAYSSQPLFYYAPLNSDDDQVTTTNFQVLMYSDYPILL
ncbi:hypothetical protein NQ317_004448 [Molorchus minor]|uniref:Uncharacterized protein n=1 Tax=Molorchus minor TaxID=1323400 RepID=A0ABQ9IY67_9CUCU|nr:hypothetical protein NQ317_004448 [Molorchus minor]